MRRAAFLACIGLAACGNRGSTAPPPEPRDAGPRDAAVVDWSGFTVLPGLSAYCMSKAAVGMMTRALAREWATKQINVTAICPGYIETELNADWFNSEGGQKQIATFPRRRLGVESAVITRGATSPSRSRSSDMDR